MKGLHKKTPAPFKTDKLCRHYTIFWDCCIPLLTGVLKFRDPATVEHRVKLPGIVTGNFAFDVTFF